MAQLIVTLTPNVSTYVPGDAPISVNIGAGNSPTGPDYLWESNSGTFDDKHLATTNFTPSNATKVVSIIGRRVFHFTLGGVLNVGSHGSYGGLYKLGATLAWDSYGFFSNALPSGFGFLECEIAEVNKEKAFGFLSNSSYKDPTITNPDINLTFGIAWHFLGNGTAIPRKAGVALSNPVVYKVGDRPRITVTPTKVTYSINGIIYATTGFPSGLSAMYALLSFKSQNAVLTNPSYYYDPENEATKTVSVTGLFPVQPNYGVDLASDNNTLVSLAEDGSATFRKKSNLKKTLSLQFNERPYSEYLALSNFWKAHEKHEKFVYQDLVLGENYIMRFETGLRVNILGMDSITIQATLKEV